MDKRFFRVLASERRGWTLNRNLRLLGVGVGIRTLGAALYYPFLALFLINVLRVGYAEIGIIIAGVGAIQLPFGVLGGALTDRQDRRRLILLGLTVEAVLTVFLAYAFLIRSLALAIIAATLGGIVLSTTAPASSAYIADLAEGPERTRGFTFYRVGYNAGYSAGVTLGGILVTYIGFAGAVGVAAGVIAVGAAFLALTLAPSPRDLSRRASEPARPAAAPPAALHPRRSLRESFAILGRDRVALELLVAFALAALVAGQWSVTFPVFVHNVLGISYSWLGIGLALNGLVVVFGQTATTESVIGRRHTTIAILGLGFYAMAFIGLGAAGFWQIVPLAVFFVAVVVLTLGENLVTIPQATLPSNIAPKEEVGAYNGAFQAISGAGFLVAVLVGGIVLSVTTDSLLLWLCLMVPAIPAVWLLRHAASRLSLDVDRA